MKSKNSPATFYVTGLFIVLSINVLNYYPCLFNAASTNPLNNG